MIRGSKQAALAAGMCIAALLGTQAAAQDEESTNRVAAKTDWSVFVEDNPTECWGVSAPKETVNTRDGRVVAVNRGEILLFVFYRPGEEVKGQVTFTGGYPFAPGSTVNVTVGSNEFELFTEGEWAWPASPADDAKIITAMKRGAEAVVTARSSRGTTTRDTFSLLGFTAAVEDAEARCGG
jgi:invasion protein IalB